MTSKLLVNVAEKPKLIRLKAILSCFVYFEDTIANFSGVMEENEYKLLNLTLMNTAFRNISFNGRFHFIYTQILTVYIKQNIIVSTILSRKTH